MGAILGSIFAALLGKILEWFKQSELEHQAALAQELKQHAESVAAAGTVQDAVDQAVIAHQQAVAQVTDLQGQLDAIKAWNTKSRELKQRAKGIKRPGA
jgi:hypothetical protein